MAAKTLGKDAVGIDIKPEFAALAETQVQPNNRMDKFKPDLLVYIADSRELYNYIAQQTVYMVSILHLQYWDIDCWKNLPLISKNSATMETQRQT